MDLIRGQKAQAALQTLHFTPKRAAKHIEKVLRSAIANAERKAEDAGAPLDVDELYVNNCFVNEGARWKRLRPAPMRSASPPSKRKPKRKRACAARRAACAKRSPASSELQRRARSKETKSGTENAPLRIPPRLQQAVEVE